MFSLLVYTFSYSCGATNPLISEKIVAHKECSQFGVRDQDKKLPAAGLSFN